MYVLQWCEFVYLWGRRGKVRLGVGSVDVWLKWMGSVVGIVGFFPTSDVRVDMYVGSQDGSSIG